MSNINTKPRKFEDTAIKNRYDFLMIFDVENGNPNGDPAAGNMPRQDFETGFGLVSAVSLKRKIRDYIAKFKKDEDGFDIMIKSGPSLESVVANDVIECGYKDVAEFKKLGKSDENAMMKVKDFLCENYFDLRTFGGVITSLSGVRGSQGIRGPVQISNAKSVDPIVPVSMDITRVVVSTEKEVNDGKNNTMGETKMVPYAIYTAKASISACEALENTGFSDADVEILWESIMNMFEEDKSAARGTMALRDLIIFKHDSAMGNERAHKLYEAITVERKPDVAVGRKYSDYTVEIGDIPDGVTLIHKT